MSTNDDIVQLQKQVELLTNKISILENNGVLPNPLIDFPITKNNVIRFLADNGATTPIIFVDAPGFHICNKTGSIFDCGGGKFMEIESFQFTKESLNTLINYINDCKVVYILYYDGIPCLTQQQSNAYKLRLTGFKL